jgi:(4S)-4-hydroxy-5-phosphonooxypentane-2,3-dione isomerase
MPAEKTDARLVPPRFSSSLLSPSPHACLSLRAMLIVHVHVQVMPDSIDAFKAATLANAQASVLEAGIARFDVVQQADDPTRFVLVEAYRDSGAPARHKDTAHYAMWRDAVAPMMAAARTSVKFSNVFPADAAW